LKGIAVSYTQKLESLNLHKLRIFGEFYKFTDLYEYSIRFLKKKKLRPDLTEPGRTATGRPSFNTAHAGTAISNGRLAG
jgi:hypothetical protein